MSNEHYYPPRMRERHIQYNSTRTTTVHDNSSCCNMSDKCRAYKNLFGLCASFMCCFGAFLGILNLQSSVNSSGGLGLTSNSILNAAFVLCATYFPLYVRTVGNKLALITGYFGFLLYSICNYYPDWYTLSIGSVILGICTGPVWVGMYSHATMTATKFSTALKEEPANAIALFTGWIAAATKLSRITGSLVSSIVLATIKTPNTTNGSTPHDNHSSLACDNTEAQHLEKSYLYYILVSVYVAYGITGIIITILTIDEYEVIGKPKIRRISLRNCFDLFINPIINVLKVFFSPYMLLLFPVCIFDGLLLAFSGGTFPEMYISDCLGIQWIGYILAIFGVVGTLFAVITGRSVKYIPQYIMVCGSLLFSICLLVVLLFWKREKNYYEIIGFAVALGGCEAVVNAAIPGLLGVLFNKTKEPAFTLFQVGVAFGQVISFSTALVLSTSHQLLILLCFAVISLLCYSLLIVIKGDNTCCFINDRELFSTQQQQQPSILTSEQETTYLLRSDKL